jgi:hypothetical protein
LRKEGPNTRTATASKDSSSNHTELPNRDRTLVHREKANASSRHAAAAAHVVLAWQHETCCCCETDQKQTQPESSDTTAEIQKPKRKKNPLLLRSNKQPSISALERNRAARVPNTSTTIMYCSREKGERSPDAFSQLDRRVQLPRSNPRQPTRRSKSKTRSIEPINRSKRDRRTRARAR